MKKIIIIALLITGVIVGSVVVSKLTQKDGTANVGIAVNKPSDSSSPMATNDSSAKLYTTAQVSEHATSNDCWVIIDNEVFDVTSYLNEHPGGANRIAPFCGKDATKAFATKGGDGTHTSTANTIKEKYRIGRL